MAACIHAQGGKCQIGCYFKRPFSDEGRGKNLEVDIAPGNHCPWAEDKEWDEAASFGSSRGAEGCYCYSDTHSISAKLRSIASNIR